MKKSSRKIMAKILTLRTVQFLLPPTLRLIDSAIEKRVSQLQVKKVGKH